MGSHAADLRVMCPHDFTSLHGFSGLFFPQEFDDVIPSVQSWSMALMMRSHSSARVRQPHSPSRGTYRSSFCSSSISGTLMPSSSGNVATKTRQYNLKTCSCNSDPLTKIQNQKMLNISTRLKLQISKKKSYTQTWLVSCF